MPFSAGRRGSTGELFGAAIATIQNRSFIKRAPIAFDAALLFLIVIASFWAPRGKRFALFGWGAFCLVIYALIALSIFAWLLVWVPILLPAGMLLFIALFRAVTPGRERVTTTTQHAPRRAR